jgi:hypothetical protein
MKTSQRTRFKTSTRILLQSSMILTGKLCDMILTSARGEATRYGNRVVLEGDQLWGQGGQCPKGHGRGDEAAGSLGGGDRGHQILQAPLLQAGPTAQEPLNNLLIDLYKACLLLHHILLTCSKGPLHYILI